MRTVLVCTCTSLKGATPANVGCLSIDDHAIASDVKSGLGSALTASLAAARTAAANARARLADGLDPRAAKSSDRTSPAFGEVADRHIETMEPRWHNTKHRDQWRMTLNVYAEPLRGIPVDQICNEGCVGRPAADMAREYRKLPLGMRGRIEAVLDAAQAQGLAFRPQPGGLEGQPDIHSPTPAENDARPSTGHAG